MFAAAFHLLNPCVSYISCLPRGILPVFLAARGSHVTLASPIRSSYFRLCFGRQNAGRNRIEVLVSKAMDATCPPGGLVCTFWCPVQLLAVYVLILASCFWNILRAACYRSMIFSFA